jgi:peptide deformylase
MAVTYNFTQAPLPSLDPKGLKSLTLVPSSDPGLKLKCHDFNFVAPPFEPIEFSKELVKLLYDHNGLGIAANQVGVQYRVFAMRGSPSNFVCFNPRIVDFSEKQVTLEEGCLTYPGLFVKVKRPIHIKVRFETPNGETRTETFTGMSARIFQHELDHLNGIIFYSRANRYHRDQAFKRQNLNQRKTA